MYSKIGNVWNVNLECLLDFHEPNILQLALGGEEVVTDGQNCNVVKGELQGYQEWSEFMRKWLHFV